MKRIIFFTIFLDCVLSATIAALIVNNVSQAQADRQAMILLRTINSGMNFSGNAFLESMRPAHCRVLHVGENGDILFDNRYDVKNTDAKNKKIRYSSFNRNDGTQIRAAIPSGKFFTGKRSAVAIAALVLSAIITLSLFLTKKNNKKNNAADKRNRFGKSDGLRNFRRIVAFNAENKKEKRRRRQPVRQTEKTQKPI